MGEAFADLLFVTCDGVCSRGDEIIGVEVVA